MMLKLLGKRDASDCGLTALESIHMLIICLRMSEQAFLWLLMRFTMLQLLKNLRFHAKGKEIADSDILTWANHNDTWEELDPDELSYEHTVIPLQHLVSFGLNLVSRSFEFQADAFAQKLGYAPLLREENLSAMNTNPWYSAYHYSHPPFVERLAAIDELTRRKTENEHRLPKASECTF